jgi:hypothetical protein
LFEFQSIWPLPIKFAQPVRNFGSFFLLKCGEINILKLICANWFFVKQSIICGEIEMN